MNELIIPEIVFKDFVISCSNTECEQFEVEAIVQAPEQCQEIVCGPCGIASHVTALQ